MKFSDHVSMEILSPLFGTLHPGFYQAARKDFSYEHWPQSQAHISRDKDDFYYMRAFFGGSVVEVHRLTLACHQAMGVNLATGIEAVWHNESHLNRYLLDHKPIKVLSPEDLWDPQLLGCPRRTCGTHSSWAVPERICGTLSCWAAPGGPVGPTAPGLSPRGSVGPSAAGLPPEDLWDPQLLGCPPS
uniref:histo-blood group ABO system transferase 2-like n=1 Tax=Halichoerus grypus TaxID=9711 RepID=UPI001658D4FD|nr:histo-blood group ABO system transferase 2-like [Halichoerus grypus]XP_035960285.1 histo-blood group ABO system transferase 2-like [Halichoerus grypus]XP_035966048.1 histo-blood group ABO system transferase 2-like [Halichoerus grypus]